MESGNEQPITLKGWKHGDSVLSLKNNIYFIILVWWSRWNALGSPKKGDIAEEKGTGRFLTSFYKVSSKKTLAGLGNFFCLLTWILPDFCTEHDWVSTNRMFFSLLAPNGQEESFTVNTIRGTAEDTRNSEKRTFCWKRRRGWYGLSNMST